MEELGLGVGLAALAFWGFVAAVSVASIWNGIRKRDAQHETIRRLVESGQPLDQDLMEKLSLTGDTDNSRPDQDFYITALWILPISAGLFFFALILGAAVAEAKAPLLGVSALLACLGVGWLVAAKIARRWYEGGSAE